jgi:nucleoside-diphosphate-sugar epimerase
MNPRERDAPRKRILVAGAAGFIGRSVVAALRAESDAEIHAVGRNPASPFGGGICYHVTDLLDAEDTDRVFDLVRPTHLIQLAWCSEHNVYWRDHANFSWIDSNLRIARAFLRNGGERCLFAGTSAEYDWKADGPFHEFLSPLKPQLLYGASKLACFHALSAFFEQEKVSWSWARMFCPFGPNEDRRRLIPKTCLRILAGETLDFDSARDLRDFLHVEDVAAALCATLRSDLQGPVNVASGQPVTVREVLTLVARHLGREEAIRFAAEGPDQPVPSQPIVADVTRLVEEAGWSPEKTLSDRLKETCEWWKTQR